MFFHKEKEEKEIPREDIYQKLKDLEAAYDRRELDVEEYEGRKEKLLEKLE